MKPRKIAHEFLLPERAEWLLRTATPSRPWCLGRPLRWHDGMLFQDPEVIDEAPHSDGQLELEWRLKQALEPERETRRRRKSAKKPTVTRKKRTEYKTAKWYENFTNPPTSQARFEINFSYGPAPSERLRLVDRVIDQLAPVHGPANINRNIAALIRKGLSVANASQAYHEFKGSAAAVAVVMLEPGRMQDPAGGAVKHVLTCGTVSEALIMVLNAENDPYYAPFEAVILDREREGEL